LVWVQGGSATGQPMRDSGVILRLDCSYEDHETGALCSNGIMVKLQISNTRGIFAPEQVSLMETSLTTASSSATSSSPATRRRPSRKLRSQVTPSPDPLMVAASYDKAMDTKVDPSLAKTPQEDDGDDGTGAGTGTGTGTGTNTRTVQKATKPRPQRTSKRPAIVTAKEEEEEEEKKKQDEQESPTKSKFFADKKKAPRQAAKKKPSKIKMEVEENISISANASVASNTDELGRKRGGEIANPPKDGERNILSDSSDDDEVKEKEKPLVPLKKKKKPPPTATTSTSKQSKAKTTKKKAVPDTTKSTTDNQKKDQGVVRQKLLLAQESDSDDEKDRPFRIEYSVTGRATCKTCDERIPQGQLRVGHRPLFRGKPGYVVYRHLQCALFSEPISQMAHVGGWRRLSSEDQQALQGRIDASLVLNEKEDDELHADELVPVVFQGEMRNKPPGFVGSLLPFQQEGVSWMYHQERQLPDLRGGILADEMGMVRNIVSRHTHTHDKRMGDVSLFSCGASINTYFNTIILLCIVWYRERPFKPLPPFWTTVRNFNTVNLE
jgi:hypothetical protein